MRPWDGKEATPNEPLGRKPEIVSEEIVAQPLRDRERSLEIGIRQQERELVAPSRTATSLLACACGAARDELEKRRPARGHGRRSSSSGRRSRR